MLLRSDYKNNKFRLLIHSDDIPSDSTHRPSCNSPSISYNLHNSNKHPRHQEALIPYQVSTPKNENNSVLQFYNPASSSIQVQVCSMPQHFKDLFQVPD